MASGGGDEFGPLIAFEATEKRYESKAGFNVVLRPTDLVLPKHRHIAVLGPKGAGKSVFLRLCNGSEPATRGRVRRFGRISWALDNGTLGEKKLTGRENVAFAARVFGGDPSDVIAFVREFSGLGRHFDMPLSTYNPVMKQQLYFAAAMAIDFDALVIDEALAGGDPAFRERCNQAIAERRRTTSILLASPSVALIRAYCESAVVLIDGQAFFFDDVEEALAELKCYLRVQESA